MPWSSNDFARTFHLLSIFQLYAITTPPLLASIANDTNLSHSGKDIQMLRLLVAVFFLPKTILTKLADSIRNSAGVSGRDVLPIDVLGDDASNK